MPNEKDLYKLIEAFELFSQELNQRVTVLDLLIFLQVAVRGEMAMTDLAKLMELDSVETTRRINILADYRLTTKKVSEGFGVIYTEPDPNFRVSKIIYLTHKGKELKEKLLDILEMKVKSGK